MYNTSIAETEWFDENVNLITFIYRKWHVEYLLRAVDPRQSDKNFALKFLTGIEMANYLRKN